MKGAIKSKKAIVVITVITVFVFVTLLSLMVENKSCPVNKPANSPKQTQSSTVPAKVQQKNNHQTMFISCGGIY